MLTYFILLISFYSYGGEKPAWLNSPPKDDLNKYYIGRSTGASDEASAISTAIQSAQDQVIRENFGSIVKISQQSFESTTEATAVKRIDELSDAVKLVSFEQQDFYVEENSGKWSAWTLYKYSKEEIRVEKDRLKNLNKNISKEINFSTVGGGSSGAMLEIISEPQGAEVFIDNSRWGLTPLRITGIARGTHLLRLQHPIYNDIEEQIVVTNSKQAVSKIMIRAKRKLHIETTPTGAFISINGKIVGTSPTDYQVTAGEKFILTSTHPETNPQSLEYFLEKGNEIYPIKLSLTYKPAFFSVLVAQSNHELSINSQSIGKSTGQAIPCEPRENMIKVSANGFSSYQVIFNCVGGKTTPLPSIDLAAAKYELKVMDFRSADYLTGGKLSATGSSVKGDPTSPYGFGIFIETRSKSELRYSAGIDLYKSSYQYDDGEFTSQAARLALGAIYRLSWNLQESNHAQFELLSDSSSRKFSATNGRSITTGTKVLYGVSANYFYEYGNSKGLMRGIFGLSYFMGGNTVLNLGFGMGFGI